MAGELDRALEAIATADSFAVTGKVRAIVGLAIRASLPGVRIGDVVEIERRGKGPRMERSIGSEARGGAAVDRTDEAMPSIVEEVRAAAAPAPAREAPASPFAGTDPEPLLAEVVGFELDDATLLPLGDAHGVGPDDPVRATGRPLAIRASDALLGRVLDGLGRPIDGRPAPQGDTWPVMRDAPGPLARARIERPLVTGLRAIDGLMTLGEGQRVGLFAGSGVGKSTLLGQIARQADSDVVVVGLVGERGREVREFIEDCLGKDGLRRSVIVAATSDAPALVRLRSAWVATAIAEYFRDRGRRVLLLMDSVTRFARAAREVGLAAGEPPARRGFPPSVFASLPKLLERSGTSDRGAITAVYTVLVEGGDHDEPIADEVRGILDGHVVLDRELAARGRWPAIDPGRSLSRVMDQVTTEEHVRAARRLRGHLAIYEAKRDLVLLGAYPGGQDPRLDAALARIDAIEAFLSQERHAPSAFQDTLDALSAIG